MSRQFAALHEGVSRLQPSDSGVGRAWTLGMLSHYALYCWAAIQKGDWGRYADKDGKLYTGFATDLDITGGNSGSPVINAKGELIGLAYDGNWESMAGDLYYNPKYNKCVCVDIRFVLWIIDKYAGASNLLNEISIVE